MNILFYVSIFIVLTLFVIIFIKNNKLKKEIKILQNNEKTLKTNQQNLHTTLSLLTSNLTKASANIEKQYTSIKQIEQSIIVKLTPLLDNNKIVDDLRRRVKEADATAYQLRSAILQMAEALKRMQKKEKDEEKAVIRSTKRKPKNQIPNS